MGRYSPDCKLERGDESRSGKHNPLVDGSSPSGPTKEVVQRSPNLSNVVHETRIAIGFAGFLLSVAVPSDTLTSGGN